MRRHRTIYFNDGCHFYLFVFDPPMRLEDAWRPVDEVAGTAVDTLVYGVSRSEGLFYPSRVGQRYGADKRPFKEALDWRTWENMQSLLDRGLDPLAVLIDRAHEKGIAFFASLRIGSYGEMAPEHRIANGGRGFVHPEVRDHQFVVLQELATRYPVQGVELDFAASPRRTAPWFRPEDATEHISVMTDFMRRVARMAHDRPGGPCEVGARIYPTEAVNLRTGLDVRAWLREGLVDYLVPLVDMYTLFILDVNMPIEWLVEASHEYNVSVYGMLQPHYRDVGQEPYGTEHATPAMMRAAAANYWEMGVDGLYAWRLEWPLTNAGRRILTELGDPDLVKEGDKHYFLRWRHEGEADYGYQTYLPLEIAAADPQERYRIPFSVADDTRNSRVARVELRISVKNLVSADRLEVLLNGRRLAREACRRTPIRHLDPYSGQWLAFEVDRACLEKGRNLLEVTLKERPSGLNGGVRVEDVEIIVAYGTYSAGPDA